MLPQRRLLTTGMYVPNLDPMSARVLLTIYIYTYRRVYNPDRASTTRRNAFSKALTSCTHSSVHRHHLPMNRADSLCLNVCRRSQQGIDA